MKCHISRAWLVCVVLLAVLSVRVSPLHMHWYDHAPAGDDDVHIVQVHMDVGSSPGETGHGIEFDAAVAGEAAVKPMQPAALMVFAFALSAWFLVPAPRCLPQRWRSVPPILIAPWRSSLPPPLRAPPR